MSPDSPSLDPQPYTVNPGPDDDDPINNDRRSSTTSVASDFNNLKEIYGRLFKGESWQPVDNMHRDYEMSLHQLISGLYEPLAGLKLFHAPLESNGHPQWKVLDVGTGFGFWAVDFADQFQSASVVGIDVSPGMPDSVPPNAQFQVEDVSRFPWTLEDNYFDFIFIRNFGVCFSTKSVPAHANAV
ncbi:S-adenosyl-L-methionine-dependent methyltransferase [Immersiella caudata]|uniref:S-adenosyl-L-methionine-dependent methyltransferase n=1 Tax=Immersiella caudata TaxID=314043 RepID=A0AA40CBT3_9PEZI|nr:S-adenosyl-L-methionine-dependent methyltransferase [Immersiella caudata]